MENVRDIKYRLSNTWMENYVTKKCGALYASIPDEIMVNADKWDDWGEDVQHFFLAHERGHQLMHRDILLDGVDPKNISKEETIKLLTKSLTIMRERGRVIYEKKVLMMELEADDYAREIIGAATCIRALKILRKDSSLLFNSAAKNEITLRICALEKKDMNDINFMPITSGFAKLVGKVVKKVEEMSKEAK